MELIYNHKVGISYLRRRSGLTIAERTLIVMGICFTSYIVGLYLAQIVWT